MAGRAAVDDAPDALIASAAVAPLAVPSPARRTAPQAAPGDREPAIDLEVVLAGVTAGISVQDATGRLVYVNALAAQMAGFESPEAMLAASPEDLLSRFTLIGEDGEPFDPAKLPGRLVLHGETAEPVLIGFRLADGTEGWSLLHARATTLPDGSTVAVNTFHDVTPRVESERRIRERETRFREMAEHRRRAEDRLESVMRHMPVGVILVDASDGRLLFANDAARRLPHIRFRVGDVPLYLGNPGYRQDGSEVADDEWPLRRAIRGESVQNDVLTIVTDAGTRRSYSISASPMHDRSGGVDLVIETATDITERVLAEERERFLAQASVVLASSLDYAQTVQSVADLAVPQFADWCIVQLADEEGVPRRIAVAHRDPDKLALAIRASNDYPPDPDSPSGAAAILRDGHTEYHPDVTPERLDAAARNSDHRAILRALSLRSAISVPLTASGRILGVLTLINGESGRRFEPEDVAFAEALAERAAAAIEKARLFREGVRLAASEHARAAELNAVIRAMGEGVFVCDRDGRIILANPAAEGVFPDVEERTYADILAELDDPDELAPPLGRNGGPVELRARRGEERWIEVATWPVGADRAADLREETIVVLRDVTEARQRQAVRDTFIGVLSHELRTPVTTIYAGAKVLSRPGELSAETRTEIFDDMVVEAERLHRLVEDVVAMTRFGDEGGDVGAEPVLLQRLLPTVIASEESRWPGVTFGLEVPGALPTVVADPTYVEQVVRNLLSNAAKYGGSGSSVRVAVEETADEVLVRIIDNGPGFPADESDQLFELFFRSAEAARTASGAGIGLFVCARLIRAMGGRIWARNGDLGGAEFGFALRVMDEDS